MSFLDALFGGSQQQPQWPQQEPPRPSGVVPQAGTVRLGERGAHGYTDGKVSVEPWLVDTVREATRVLPQGYRAEVISSVDKRQYPNGVTTPWHPGGHAVDIQIYDANGNKVPNLGGPNRAPGYDIYENVAAAAKAYQQEKYPDKTFTWGGHFSDKSLVPSDRMHFQSGGSAAGGGFTPQRIAQAGAALKTAQAQQPDTEANRTQASAWPTPGTTKLPPSSQPTLASYARTPDASSSASPAQTAISSVAGAPTGRPGTATPAPTAVPLPTPRPPQAPQSAGDVAAAAATPAPAPASNVPLPRPKPPIPSVAAPAPSAPGASAGAAGAAPSVSPAASGGAVPLPRPRPQLTTLGDQIVKGMGPQGGAGMTTFTDPATGHQFLSGQQGDQTIMRDLGPVSMRPATPTATQLSLAPRGMQAPAARPAPPAGPPPLDSGARPTPASTFDSPRPIPGGVNQFTGMPDLKGPTPPAPDEAGALAPQSANPVSNQTPRNVAGVTLTPPQAQPPPSPQPPQQPPQPQPDIGGWPAAMAMPPVPYPPRTTGQMPWSPFASIPQSFDPGADQPLQLSPIQPDWWSFASLNQ